MSLKWVDVLEIAIQLLNPSQKWTALRELRRSAQMGAGIAGVQ